MRTTLLAANRFLFAPLATLRQPRCKRYPRSMAASLKLLQGALQPLQFLTRLCELSGSSQLLIIAEVPSRLGDQGVDVVRSCGRHGCGARWPCRRSDRRDLRAEQGGGC